LFSVLNAASLVEAQNLTIFLCETELFHTQSFRATFSINELYGFNFDCFIQKLFAVVLTATGHNDISSASDTLQRPSGWSMHTVLQVYNSDHTEFWMCERFRLLLLETPGRWGGCFSTLWNNGVNNHDDDFLALPG
jgi:hypothetical protein